MDWQLRGSKLSNVAHFEKLRVQGYKNLFGHGAYDLEVLGFRDIDPSITLYMVIYNIMNIELVLNNPKPKHNFETIVALQFVLYVVFVFNL